MARRTKIVVTRIQTGVRLESRIVKVLKALAEYRNMGLGDLLEGIVLHSFEGKTPFSPDTLRKIRDEGYSLYLLVDCKRDPGEIEPFTFATAPRLTSGEPVFQIDVRDLSFLRSIGIDPTRRLRRRRVS